jgi:putative membrane protein
MGSADIIPGVSGGTVALITGIYERLISAIKSIDFKFIVYGIRGLVDTEYRVKAKENLSRIDVMFLFPLIVGVAVAFLLLANVIGFFLESYPTYTYAFFFGLILSSSFFVYKSSQNTLKVTSLIFIASGVLSGYILVGVEAIQTEHSLLIIFFSGVITFCAMILPGLSGAFILLVLGQYDFMLGVLRGLTRLEWSNVSFAFAYVLGGVVGLLGFSRALSFLIKHYRVATLSFILGLMVGALRKPGEYIMSNPENIGYTILAALGGVVIVSLFTYYEFHGQYNAKSE